MRNIEQHWQLGLEWNFQAVRRDLLYEALQNIGYIWMRGAWFWGGTD
jgi:hypothetical protein